MTRNRVWSAVLAAALLFSIPALAQVSTATLSGGVTDGAGGMLPHVKVTAIETRTGVKTESETNDSGQYNIPFLQAGTYTLIVEATGYKKQQQNLALSGGDHPTIDIALQIGAMDQTIDVTSAAALLSTSDASIGQVITTKQVEDLPLNGRTPLSFVQYSPGVIATTNPSGVHAYDNSAIAGFSVAGLPNKNAETLLDGSPDNLSDNSPAYSPPIDATAEVKLNVFESDAAYGHSGGGVANQITKSGTNRFHGSLFEYNQISALNSNGYFANRVPNSKKTVTRYNQFGGSIGGPVWIPKVFDGHDKLFFFLAYEGIRTPFPGLTTTTVPTADERNGDFSKLLGSGTTTSIACVRGGVTYRTAPHDIYQIYNPAGGLTLANPNCPGVFQRTPFANNKIPTSINPVAAKVLSYYPQPNLSGDQFGVGNLSTVNNGADLYDNHFGRLDWNVGPRNRMYITGRHNERNQVVNQLFGPSNISQGDTLQRINWGGSIGDIITVSPSLIAEVRLNYTRFVQTSLQHGDGFDFTTLGFPAGLGTASTHKAFPMFLMSNTTASLGTTTMTPGAAPFNSYGIYADAIKSLGTHTLKFGTDLRRFQKGQLTYATGNNTPTSASGRYQFSNAFTQSVVGGTDATVLGQDVASLFLGLPSLGTFDTFPSAVGDQYYMSFFVQDDWRVTPNLTLNLGLRFDKDFSPTERGARAVNGFDTTTQNPIAGKAIAAYNANPVSQIPVGQFAVNGGLTFASPNDKRFSQFTSNMFSPRFGFAWQPNLFGKQTVVRGGFGFFVLPIFPFNNSISQQGFAQQTSQAFSNDNYATASTTLSNPFPNGITQPSGSSQGLATFVGQGLSILSPVIRNGYAERFTFDVQRQLPFGILGEVAYIGNVAHRLPISQFPNFVKPQYETTASNPGLAATVSNPFRGLIPNGGALNGSSVRLAQLLAVYPQFPVDGITVLNAPAGSSNYHALEAHAERRIQHGLTFIANYQFSKLLEAVTYLNNSDPRPEYRISQYDRPHHLVVGVTYDLPYGKGREFGAHAPIWLDLPLGGWVVNSLYLVQSGAPLAFGNIAPFDKNNLKYNPRQATEASVSTTVPAFNTAAFATAANAQPQFNIRTLPTQFSNLRTDKLMNWDASVLKNFNFTDAAYFQFRFEAFNVANRPSFAAPNLTPTASQFGQITGTQNGQRVVQMAGRIVF